MINNVINKYAAPFLVSLSYFYKVSFLLNCESNSIRYLFHFVEFMDLMFFNIFLPSCFRKLTNQPLHYNLSKIFKDFVFRLYFIRLVIYFNYCKNKWLIFASMRYKHAKTTEPTSMKLCTLMPFILRSNTGLLASFYF